MGKWNITHQLKEIITNTQDKVDEYQKYAEQKKPDTKEANPNSWIYEVLDRQSYLYWQPDG